jgi:hypothetical protein
VSGPRYGQLYLFSFLPEVECLLHSAPESVIVGVDVVSVSNHVPMLGCPFHRGNQFVKQGRAPSLSCVEGYVESTYRIVCISQEGAYYL